MAFADGCKVLKLFKKTLNSSLAMKLMKVLNTSNTINIFRGVSMYESAG